MGSRSRNGRETFGAAPPAGVDQDKGAEQSEWNRGWEARAEAAAGGGEGRGGARPRPLAPSVRPPARRARASLTSGVAAAGRRGRGPARGAGPGEPWREGASPGPAWAKRGGRGAGLWVLGFLPPLPGADVRPSGPRLCGLRWLEQIKMRFSALVSPSPPPPSCLVLLGMVGSRKKAWWPWESIASPRPRVSSKRSKPFWKSSSWPLTEVWARQCG